MKSSLLFFLLAVVIFPLKGWTQATFKYNAEQILKIRKLKAKVEANTENIDAHYAFIYAFTLNDPSVAEQYNELMNKFPKSFTIPFAIGEVYVNQRNPKAKFFLEQASKLRPDSPKVWNLLSQFALFTDNLKLQQEYLQKAINLDPKNAEYAFYYAYSFLETNPARYDSLSLEVARRFPKNEHGTMALYWLSAHSNSLSEKKAYLKQLSHTKENSNYYLSSMTDYFDLLLNNNPSEALEFGLSMILDGGRNRNLWYERIRVAKSFLQVRELLTKNNPDQALTLLNKIDLGTIEHGNLINAKETLALLKAEAADEAKQTNLAYDSLSTLYSKRPTDKLHKALYRCGNKLGLDSINIMRNVYKIRASFAKPATDFCLDNYLSTGKSGLSDYIGKVILLTYWHPGCFTCKEQFSHFEPVIKRFDTTKVAYLALNIEPIEDEFVLPFLKASGYSFIPLRDDMVREKGNLKTTGATVNFVIDQKGRILFSNLERSKEDERTLELMIKETLAAKN